MAGNAIKRFITFIALLTPISCSVGPNFHSPSPPKVQAYTNQAMPIKTTSAPVKGGNAQFFKVGESIPTKWWTLFHSPSLNTLIEMGLKNNPSIAQGQAALRVAKENLRVQFDEAFVPSVDAQGNLQKQRISGTSFGGSNPMPSSFNLLNTSVNVSYTLDLFGGARRELEALCAQVNYQEYLLEGTHLTLAANIATTAIQEASLREQIKATKELIALEEDLLTIISKQFELGAISQNDVLSQQSQLAQTKTLLPPLEKSLAQNRHALSALVGKFPSVEMIQTFTLDELTLPSELPISFPGHLVRQRPDIRAQEALLHQASAQIGVVTAAMFPQLSLSGSYGYEASQLSQLFNPAASIWTIGAQLLQPVFHGGALLAQRRAAIASFDEVFAQYQQTVLQAYQNVADTLAAIEYDAKYLASQTEAEKAALNLLVLTKGQYQLGAVDYQSLLNAQRQYQQALINRIQAQAARFNDTAALFQALGGGWWHAPTQELIHG